MKTELNGVSAVPGSSLLSPPVLSTDLISLYGVMPDDSKKLFNKVYLWLWGYVYRLQNYIRRTNASAGLFWAVDLCREKLGLSSSQLSLLSFIYYISGGGSQILHSDRVYNGPACSLNVKVSKQRVLVDLSDLGFITRSTRNNSTPYLSSSHDRHPVFIKMTDKGIKVMQGIEGDIYKMLLTTSMNDLTGVNKKP